MEKAFRAVDSIIKARDDRTKISPIIDNSYLYTIMLSHVEHIKSNLYNFKFIGRMINYETTREIYMNMQVLINDSSVVTNSKYYIADTTRSEYVKSYQFDKKENQSNSYRIDLSMSTSNEANKFFLLELVNQYTNTSIYTHITQEMFFKISIFIYNMIDINIIDGNIFLGKINKFRMLSPTEESYKLLLESSDKLYTIYWNQLFIKFYLEKVDGIVSSYQITYSPFPKDIYQKIKNTIGEQRND